MTAPTIKITDMEEQTPYHVAYIASAEEPATDPDIVAYNECKIAIHMAEEMLAQNALAPKDDRATDKGQAAWMIL